MAFSPTVLTFAEAARRFSAAPTKEQGGQLDWMPLSNLPPAVGQKLLTLGPGDVGDPMVLPNAVALFQMNDVSDAVGPAPVAVQVEYAQYVLSPDQDPAQILSQASTAMLAQANQSQQGVLNLLR